MIKKMLAGPAIAGAVLLGTATLAEAQEAQTTPPDNAAATTDSDDDGDDSSKAGLLGLLGLVGLAGLAGLKRRDPDVGYGTATSATRPR